MIPSPLLHAAVLPIIQYCACLVNLLLKCSFGECSSIKTQGVHKVLLQFENIITKAVDEVSLADLFYFHQC